MDYQKANPESIQKMFNAIAPTYDKTNSFISLGLYSAWQRKLVKEVSKKNGTKLMDLCSGTGDIAFHFLTSDKKGFATLLDFSEEMLKIAKIRGEPFKNRFETIVGDAQKLGVNDISYDSASISFGIRNVESPDKCFKEVFRILRPKGVFGILEATRPQNPFLFWGHHLFLKLVVPMLGKLLAKDKKAYRYLSQSISSFLSPQELQSSLLKVGFKKVEIKPLLGGVATLIIAHKE